MQKFEAADVARLERAYSTPQIVDQRRRFRAAVAARPGEVGLDVVAELVISPVSLPEK